MGLISRNDIEIKEGLKSLAVIPYQVKLEDVETSKKTWLNYRILVTKSSVTRPYLISIKNHT